MEIAKLVNMEEWEETHGPRFYALFDTSDGAEGEGLIIAESNNPRSFKSYIERLDYEGRSHYIAHGKKEPAI